MPHQDIITAIGLLVSEVLVAKGAQIVLVEVVAVVVVVVVVVVVLEVLISM